MVAHRAPLIKIFRNHHWCTVLFEAQPNITNRSTLSGIIPREGDGEGDGDGDGNGEGDGTGPFVATNAMKNP